MLREFLADEAGATAIEQALLTAFIALALIAVVTLGGRRLFEVFLELASEAGGEGSSGRLF